MKFRALFFSLLLLGLPIAFARAPVKAPETAPVEQLLQRQAEIRSEENKQDRGPETLDTQEENIPSGYPKTWKEQHNNAFLIWAGEKEVEFRWRIGFRVMFFLLLFFFLIHALKQAVWKTLDLHHKE